MALWELPPAAHRGGRLKVSRKRYPTNELELLAEMTVAEYNLRQLAHDFGPGELYLLLSADPQKLWGLHNCKLAVAPEYAAAAGFQSYPVAQPPVPYMPRINEANALQATANALAGTDRPLTVRDLAQLVEMVADRTAETMARRNPATQLQGDPMQFFGSVLQMQNVMQENAIRMAERLSGREPLDEPKESNYVQEILQHLPTLLQAFKRPDPPNPPQTQVPSAPIQETPSMQPPIQVPMTEEEIQSFSMASGMLGPWVPHILNALEHEPDTQKVAADLERFIPPALEQQLINLAKLSAERGPAVLGVLAPDLANPRGADLIGRIAAMLGSE